MTLRTASCKERCMEVAIVKHCYVHSERTNGINYNKRDKLDYVFRRTVISFISFSCILQMSFCICLHFQRVIFGTWIYNTSNEQRMDLRCSRNSLPVHWNGMLKNRRSHLAVQSQPPLN